MHLPLKRIFDEKRRLLVPVLAGITLNVVLLAGVVYPLSARVRTTESLAAAAQQQLLAARTRRCRRAWRHAGARSHGYGIEGVL